MSIAAITMVAGPLAGAPVVRFVNQRGPAVAEPLTGASSRLLTESTHLSDW